MIWEHSVQLLVKVFEWVALSLFSSLSFLSHPHSHSHSLPLRLHLSLQCQQICQNICGCYGDGYKEMTELELK